MKPEIRDNLIEFLIKSDLMAFSCDKDLLVELLHDGHPGYDKMTDDELRKEAFGEDNVCEECGSIGSQSCAPDCSVQRQRYN